MLGILLTAVALAGAPEKSGAWTHAPDVWVDPDVSPAYERALRDALAWWEDRGHPVGELIRVPVGDGARPDAGVIGLDVSPGPLGRGQLGRTRVEASSCCIVGARMELRAGLQDEKLARTMRHEVGHALGFGHTEQLGHVMYPKVSGVADLDDGLHVAEGAPSARSSMRALSDR